MLCIMRSCQTQSQRQDLFVVVWFTEGTEVLADSAGRALTLLLLFIIQKEGKGPRVSFPWPLEWAGIRVHTFLTVDILIHRFC